MEKRVKTPAFVINTNLLMHLKLNEDNNNFSISFIRSFNNN